MRGGGGEEASGEVEELLRRHATLSAIQSDLAKQQQAAEQQLEAVRCCSSAPRLPYPLPCPLPCPLPPPSAATASTGPPPILLRTRFSTCNNADV